MLRVIDTSRNQPAVYWPPTTNPDGSVVPDGFGKETFGPPVFLDPADPTGPGGGGVMWMENGELYMTADGEQRVSRAVVFTGVDVAVGGMMFNGPLSAVSQPLVNLPKKVQGAARIKGFGKIPTLRGDQFVRKAFL